MNRLDNVEQVLARRHSKQLDGQHQRSESGESGEFSAVDHASDHKASYLDTDQPPGTAPKKKNKSKGKEKSTKNSKENDNHLSARTEKQLKNNKGSNDSLSKVIKEAAAAETLHAQKGSSANHSSNETKKVRHVGIRGDEVPPRSSNHGRRFSTENPTGDGASVPFQVRYNSHGPVASGDKDKEEKRRYQKSPDGKNPYKGKRVKMEEVPDEDDLKYGHDLSGSNAPKPSYATVAAAAADPETSHTSNPPGHEEPASSHVKHQIPKETPVAIDLSRLESIPEKDFKYSTLNPGAKSFSVPSIHSRRQHEATARSRPLPCLDLSLWWI